MIFSFLTNYIVHLTPIEVIILLCIAFKLGQFVGYSKKLSELINSKNCPMKIIVPYESSEQSEFSVKCENIQYSEQASQQTEIQVVQSTKTRFDESESQRCLPEQLLKQKVDLQMKKIQSTSFFEMRLEPSSDNKFMRKIEKHELVTDYQMNASTQKQQQLVSFKINPLNALAEPNSLLELVAYQDHTIKVPSPLFEKKFISLTQIGDQWRHQVIAPWILENGRFNKFFKKSKYIGKGGFGSVVGAYSLLEQKQYAIKKIVIKGMLKMGDLLNEVNIISRYNHPNIIRFHTCWIQLATIDDALRFTALVPLQTSPISIREQEEMIYVESNSGFTFKNSSRKSPNKFSKKSSKIANKIVPLQKIQKQKNVNVNVIEIYTLHIQMELCEDNLHSYLKNRQSVNQLQAFTIIDQLISGIEFLHSNGIVHRDLKPANVLLLKNLQVKIGDFGLAALIQDHDEQFYHEKVGTPLYIAPQLNNKNRILKDQMFLVDIFSLGVIYYQLLNMFNSVTQHQRSQKLCALQINKVSISCKDLKEEKQFIKLLTKTSNRPTVFQLKQSKQYQRLQEKYNHF